MRVSSLLATLSVGAALLLNPISTTETEPVETEVIRFEDISEAEWLEMRDFQSQYYPTTGIITEINLRNDTYLWQDFNGNIWSEIGVEDLSEGDRIAVIMDNNGTSNIYDDISVCIRYVGWVY